MTFQTAAERKIPRLYHWQRFDASRFEHQMANGTVYCSNAAHFNDPWDCKPFFNTEILRDATERQRHIKWAVEICRKLTRMSERDIERMKRELEDPATLEHYVRKHTEGTQQAIFERYRVYCLCPNVDSLLMWAHYADRHCGICLEFDVRNETICGAQEVQYFEQFPMTRQYSNDLNENLLPLLAKGKHWEYEHEFRLVAQEERNATEHETLRCSDGHLKLAEGALLSVIVGHNGPYERVRDIVTKHAPKVHIQRAHLVENRYELRFGP
jgi:hypothetical protein